MGRDIGVKVRRPGEPDDAAAGEVAGDGEGTTRVVIVILPPDGVNFVALEKRFLGEGKQRNETVRVSQCTRQQGEEKKITASNATRRANEESKKAYAMREKTTPKKEASPEDLFYPNWINKTNITRST